MSILKFRADDLLDRNRRSCRLLRRAWSNPAYYYNYAFATVFKFQLHDYIARKILHQPPQSCNYADNKEVGAWLDNILKKGGTEDWRKVLKEATGEDISTRAMMDYFKPLMSWLEEQNKGRQIGWE